MLLPPRDRQYSGAMPEPIYCPACGASNPAGTSWCSLCFEGFQTSSLADDAQPETLSGPTRLEADVAAPSSAPPPPQPRDGEQLALDVGEGNGSKTWTCSFCDTKVPVGLDHCTACQRPIFDSFGGRPPTVDVDPGEALRRSLLPGGGHILLNQAVLGVTIMVLTIISLGMGIYLLRSGAVPFGAGLVFVGLTLWMLAAHDAFRIASGHADEVFLRPRVVSIVAGVWFLLIIAAAVQTQRTLDQ